MKKNKVRDTLPDIKTYYKVTVTKTGWCCKRTDSIKNPEIDPHQYGQPIFEKDAKTIQYRKESLFNSAAGISRHPVQKQ